MSTLKSNYRWYARAQEIPESIKKRYRTWQGPNYGWIKKGQVIYTKSVDNKVRSEGENSQEEKTSRHLILELTHPQSEDQ